VKSIVVAFRSFINPLVARANGPLPVLLLAAIIFGAGCIHHPLQKPARVAAPLPRSFEAPPRQSAAPTLASQKELSKHGSYTINELTLNVGQGRTLKAQYFLPEKRKYRPEKMPAIVILPIMGGSTYPLEEMFASSFAKHGYACIIPHRPNIKDEIKNLEDIDPLLRDSVRDISRGIDWLQAQPNIDGTRIGLFGISLGAIRGTLVMAMDPRIRAGVLGLGGGDLPYILTHSGEKRLVAARDKILARNNLDLKEGEARLRDAITYDPLALAPSVDPSRVMMVIAAFDHVVPPKTSWELRRKLGNPETIELWSGHYTSVIHIPYLRQASCRFFKKKFAEPNAPAIPLAAKVSSR
jgi:cephalosporin-C deacetylase-like acetyl esterase